jgi:hypothetical protein
MNFDVKPGKSGERQALISVRQRASAKNSLTITKQRCKILAVVYSFEFFFLSFPFTVQGTSHRLATKFVFYPEVRRQLA